MPLSDTRIRNAKAGGTSYKITDAKGLYLEVRPSGAKLWRYRYKLKDEGTGKPKEYLYALGEYVKAPEIETPEQARARRDAAQFTLEEARTERVRLRGLVKQGIHPIRQRQAQIASGRDEAANTFEAMGREWLAKMQPHWSASYYKHVKRVLQDDVFPTVGALPIRQVTARMIGGIMEKVAKRGAEVVAINLRQWSSSIFAHAVRKQAADGDPTGVLKGHVVRPKVQHKAPLSQDEIPAMVQKLQASGTYPVTKAALRLLLLLFVRPAELRKAEWAEFDLERAEWVVPAEKMKKREKHVVPLPSQAVDELSDLHKMTGGSKWLFPNYRRDGHCMTGTTLNHALQRMGYANKFTPHGFRATASTILHGMGYEPRVIEFQLAHKERDKTAASYNQYQWIKERRAMMQQWADSIDAWVAEGAAKVALIKRRAA